MRSFWEGRGKPITVLVVALFAVNAAARLVVRFMETDDDQQILLGMGVLALTALVAAVATFWWARRVPVPQVFGDVGLGVVVACVLTVLVGPYIAGSQPFAEGGTLFIKQILLYLAFTAGGGLLGLLTCMTIGQDWKSRGWKLHATRPRRRLP